MCVCFVNSFAFPFLIQIAARIIKTTKKTFKPRLFREANKPAYWVYFIYLKNFWSLITFTNTVNNPSDTFYV